MSREANSRFQKGHGLYGRSGGCYTCGGCHKRTRETGEGESNHGLCKSCLRKSYRDNHHWDSSPETHPSPDPSKCETCKADGYTDAYLRGEGV
jgi:hypothetical protein